VRPSPLIGADRTAVTLIEAASTSPPSLTMGIGNAALRPVTAGHGRKAGTPCRATDCNIVRPITVPASMRHAARIHIAQAIAMDGADDLQPITARAIPTVAQRPIITAVMPRQAPHSQRPGPAARIAVMIAPARASMDGIDPSADQPIVRSLRTTAPPTGEDALAPAGGARFRTSL
jgi:hypothetical protein